MANYTKNDSFIGFMQTQIRLLRNANRIGM